MNESQFEHILCKYPEIIEGGLNCKGRQVNVKGKRVDILFEDRHGQNLIVELKKGPIYRKHIAQLMDYEGYFLTTDDPTIRVMLIGNRVPPNLRKVLDHHGFEWKEFSISKLKSFLIGKKDTALLNYFEEEEITPIKSKKLKIRKSKKIAKPKNDKLNGNIENKIESLSSNFNNSDLILDESKYTLESRIKSATPDTKLLFFKFQNEIGKFSKELWGRKNHKILARPHIRGVTYLISENRAFIFLDFRKNFLYLNFYTGNHEVDGVVKGNWIAGGDQKGGKIYIHEEEDIKIAINAAKKSCSIVMGELSL